MILRRYLLRELANPFAVVCGSLLLVFTGYSSARFLGEAASGALPARLAAVLIGLKLLISLDAIVPMALMLSVALGLGRLQRDQEITALAACGIGERWLFQAVLWLAVPVALLVGLASLQVRPQLYQNVYRLEAGAERRFDLTRLPPGRFYSDFAGGVVMFSEAADGDQRLQVFAHADSGGADGVVFAQRARQLTEADGRQVVEFLDGHYYQLDPSTGAQAGNDVVISYRTLALRLDEGQVVVRKRRKATANGELAASSNPEDTAELQWRITAPVSTVLLGLLGVPISRMPPRRSRSGKLTAALLGCIVYYNLLAVAMDAVEDGKLPAWPGVLLVPLIGGLLLAVLIVLPKWRRRRA
ncbi:LPS export ABC transporter permease LptF [Immundisolibacter sp.]|uniref:LPS export ABC transporter permease LptF n=1 Tax=Immundisolibacter sp. TaxID=1934948 RepID=UPI00262D3EE7|nr:LPS export ABC transporter permease LptF [Immundisolibacter sp.]MDD3650124.1 LPS export ABC transporter permease LptF [Immundisolibacter sp.]